ncbi:GGDEF domain-containing protein [Actinoplanes sp. RD1]|uniref:GGDEF domain-containing protein n=1 Tax=Actinoplanes sp. RD1 TaxID=3064538 RepID=UPI0027413F0C|nr:GGDEF domain-containing protein [Actinoplanes sp. RD1]
MERRLVPALRILLLGFALIFLARHVPGLGPRLPDWLSPLGTVGVYVVTTSMVLLRATVVAEQRAAWALIGGGLCAYTAGMIWSWHLTADGSTLPFPSVCDVAWLSFYPLAYAGILMFLRRQAPARRTLLDGAIAGLGGAAVFSAVVVDALVGTSGAGGLEQYVALAYPLGDSLLVGTLLARMIVGRWIGAPSVLVMAGLGTFIVADTGYVTLGTMDGYQPGGLVDLLYLAGLSLVGLAAWQPARARPETAERNRLGVSIWFAFGALGVTLVATRVPLSNATVTLAGLTLVAVVLRVMASFRDLSALGQALHDEARHDALTGLVNRRGVLERLTQTLAVPRPAPLALLLLDLDKFKDVNDTYGHQAGDRLLELAAARLVAITRAGDVLGRLGGDEFVLALSGDHVGERMAAGLATRIRTALREPFDLGHGVVVTIDVSVGIALRGAGDDEISLFRRADIAMYEAKRAGGGHALHRESPSPRATDKTAGDAPATGAGGTSTGAGGTSTGADTAPAGSRPGQGREPAGSPVGPAGHS